MLSAAYVGSHGICAVFGPPDDRRHVTTLGVSFILPCVTASQLSKREILRVSLSHLPFSSFKDRPGFRVFGPLASTAKNPRLYAEDLTSLIPPPS